MQANKIKPIWLKATVIGSLWAANEIIVGSFLHNLKVPMAGSMLAFFSIMLIIAFIQVWNENGLIWRAGLICALMKSISPSAVIFGPMTGIFLEALLIELSITIFRKNLIAYFIGGALAQLSALLHKVITYLILYGWDVIKILKNLYEYSTKQLKIENISAVQALEIIIIIYIIFGIIAAFIGYIVGKSAIKTNQKIETYKTKNDVVKSKLFELTEKQEYSLFIMGFHFFVLISVLTLINFVNLIIPLFLSTIYVTFCLIRYKRALRHFKKISFWIQFALITLISSYFWVSAQNGNFFSTKGLIAGIQINLRAVFMLTCFSAISVELKNPLVKMILISRGFSQLYQSLNLAFSTLPFIIDQLPKAKTIFKNPFQVIVKMVSDIDKWFVFIEQYIIRNQSIFIITGDPQQGKTTFLIKILDSLKSNNIKLCGFVSIGKFENQKRSGFDIENIETGERYGLSQKNGTPEMLKYGKFFFHIETFKIGENIIKQNQNADCYVIDEIGPVEINNLGWASVVEYLINNKEKPQIWVVRKSLIELVQKKWNITNFQIFDITHEKPESVSEKILCDIKLLNN